MKLDSVTQAVANLLSYREVAEVLGVSDRTVFTLIKRGELKAAKIGNSVRIDPADLRDFIERSKTPSTPASNTSLAAPPAGAPGIRTNDIH